MKIIFDYNRTIYNPETKSLYPGVSDLLANLAAQHDLYLVTQKEPGGDDFLLELGIKPHFTEVFFVKEKTVDLFQKIAPSTEKVVVVGDRVRNELAVGKRAGFSTVWVRQGTY